MRACEPECGIELLAANAGKVLLSIEEYRDEAVTPAFIEMFYARLVAGIEAVPEDTSARVEGLELLCSFIDGGTGPLKGQCGDHRLIVALTALFFVSASGMFPVGNAPFAYLLYLAAPSRSGYHFSAHVPVMRLLYGTGSALCAQERGATPPRRTRRRCRSSREIWPWNTTAPTIGRSCSSAPSSLFWRSALGDDQARGLEPPARSDCAPPATPTAR